MRFSSAVICSILWDDEDRKYSEIGENVLFDFERFIRHSDKWHFIHLFRCVAVAHTESDWMTHSRYQKFIAISLSAQSSFGTSQKLLPSIQSNCGMNFCMSTWENFDGTARTGTWMKKKIANCTSCVKSSNSWMCKKTYVCAVSRHKVHKLQ